MCSKNVDCHMRRFWYIIKKKNEFEHFSNNMHIHIYIFNICKLETTLSQYVYKVISLMTP